VGRLEQIGIPTLQVDQHDIAGILESIQRIGGRCGRAGRAGMLVEDIRGRIESVAAMMTDRDRPRSLVVVDRQGNRGSIGTVWVAGPSTFYHEILELAGGENVISRGTLVYPELSTEGLLSVDPDVILEVAAELTARGVDLEDLRSDWQKLSTLRAVRAGRVHVLDRGFMVIPGPRVAQIVEAFAHALHPELDWLDHG
jgi:iron complex transport system substrate-binding protein